MLLLLRLRLFARLVCGKLFGSSGLHGLFLNLLLKPLDFCLKWLHLSLELQVLRLEGIALRFRFFKLTVEREHLTELLLANAPRSSSVGDLPHKSPSEVEAQLPLGV